MSRVRVLQGAILQDGFGICAKAHVEGTSSPQEPDFKKSNKAKGKTWQITHKNKQMNKINLSKKI